MVKPLAFKGDKKSRKRKIPPPESSHALEEGDSKGLTVQNATAEAEDDDSWVTAEAATDVVGVRIPGAHIPSLGLESESRDTSWGVFALKNVF